MIDVKREVHLREPLSRDIGVKLITFLVTFTITKMLITCLLMYHSTTMRQKRRGKRKMFSLRLFAHDYTYIYCTAQAENYFCHQMLSVIERDQTLLYVRRCSQWCQLLPS